MKRQSVVIATFLLGALLSVGCAPELYQEHKFRMAGVAPGGHLTQSQAIEVAKAEAKRRGIDLQQFKDPECSYSDGTWLVVFDALAPCLGCHFSISVIEKDQSTFYGPGR
jgi:hypothetical protein